MIDFRYHLVSIIAIFLALALGLVVGASALRGPLVDQLKDRSGQLEKDNQSLRTLNRTTDQINGYDDQVMDNVAPQIVSGRLKGESVVFIEAPGADDQMRAKAADLIGKAGARISGYVTLQEKYLDANQLTTLTELTDQLKPATVDFPQDASPYDRTALELAAVLATRQASSSGQEDPAAGQVLSGFKTAGFLNYSGQPATRATLAIVIAPTAASKDKDADAENKALVALPMALSKYANGTVVAGNGDAASDGGMIKAIRDAGKAQDHVSTVDTGDVSAGRLTTVFALDFARQGKFGDYGVGSNVDGPMPTPVPTVPEKK
ncbi:copper transporter [Actinoallomurus acaciae]|uniref:Copper transporter n=1 Tax=Actinoallomurus acaciae TaxID=502577 RepID=A0ABV5YX29_9ACTN